jgi:1-deoxy-D-xylulose-5-phosphate synthase
MVLMMPKDENELRNMLYTAVNYDDGPIALRYPREPGLGVAFDDEPSLIPIGQWATIREGDSAAILALGPMVKVAEEAAELLKREGLQVRVVNARFVKPLDEAMLLQLAGEGIPILVLEEGSQLGGLGGAVLEFYARQHLHNVPVRISGVPDVFVEHASIQQQREETGLNAQDVAHQVRTAALRQRQRAT